MLFEHRDHAGRGVRLAYCMNLHPASDLEGVLEGMRTITLPLAARLDAERSSGGFGVGMYLPAEVALALMDGDGSDLARLVDFLHLDKRVGSPLVPPVGLLDQPKAPEDAIPDAAEGASQPRLLRSIRPITPQFAQQIEPFAELVEVGYFLGSA